MRSRKPAESGRPLADGMANGGATFGRGQFHGHTSRGEGMVRAEAV